MADILLSKFTLNPRLQQQLLATGNRRLIDGHYGQPDLVWGFHVPSNGAVLHWLTARLARCKGINPFQVPARN